MELGKFQIPDEKERTEALGSLAGETFSVRKHLQAIVPNFKSVRAPGPSDWLSSHSENG